jgi:FSR family fosmidomycin resistance protein-like MFS transporter
MVAGMGATLLGLLGLSFANSYGWCWSPPPWSGSAPPSSTRKPRGWRGTRRPAGRGSPRACSRSGGHAGYAIGPLLAAAVVVPRGQASLAWFSGVALLAMALMAWTAGRYVALRREQAASRTSAKPSHRPLPAGRVVFAMAVLIVLLFSKNAYTAAFTSYYTFYLIERFGVTVQVSQLMLFLYLVVGALGVIVGGIIGDRIGRDRVIWLSILGSLPFALLLPYADLFWTGVLSVVISLVMASAFSSILIYAIDLVPHRVGLVGGLFYGLAFGWAGSRRRGSAWWPTGSASSRCSASAPGCRPSGSHLPAAAERPARVTGRSDRASTGRRPGTISPAANPSLSGGTASQNSAAPGREGSGRRCRAARSRPAFPAAGPPPSARRWRRSSG